MEELKKTVYSDCAKSMWKALIFNVISECCEVLVVVLIAGYLGKYAYAIINGEAITDNSILIRVIFSLLFMIFAVPIIDFIKNLLMLNGSLQHDRYLYRHYLQMEYTKVREIEPGEIQYRLENDPIDLRFYWMEIITKYVVTSVAIIFLEIQSINISGGYTIIVMGISVSRFIIPILLHRYEKKYDKQMREYESMTRVLENEYFSELSFIKRNKLIKSYIFIFKRNFNHYFKESKQKQIFCNVLNTNLNVFLQRLSYMIILIVGCLFVKNHVINIGEVIAMLGYSSIYDRICFDIGFIIRKKPILINSYERIAMFYENKEVYSGIEFLPTQSISFRNLSFSYGDKLILHNFNDKILINKKNVIVGKNGSGKSTLLKLLCGLEKDYQGEIFCDNNLLSNIDISYWRKNIGMAFQKPIVFQGSIKDNILLFCKDVNEKVVEKIIYSLGMEKIKGRVLSNDEKNISGGELQKISIARALLCNPYLLILDEPNNHLDTEAIHWLYNFIKNYEGTLIYIAHSKKFIELADNIVKV